MGGDCDFEAALALDELVPRARPRAREGAPLGAAALHACGRRGGGRFGRRGGGGVPKHAVDLLTIGTFTRGSEGSYYVGAAGDTTFMAWATTNTRRPENRGDGAGALLLLESAGTNKLLQSEDLLTTWATLNSPVLTSDAQTAPDGVTDADRVAYAAAGSAGQVRQTLGSAVFTSSVPAVLTAFIRKGNSVDQLQMFFRNKSAIDSTLAVTPSSAWARYALAIADTGSGATATLSAFIESTDAADFDIWGVQIEERRAPSSYIRTTTAAMTRAADSLEIASSALPVSIWTKRWRFAQYSPREAHTDLVSGDVRWFFTIGGSSDGVRLRHDGSSVLVEAIAGGVVKATSGALTFARHALLGRVEWDPIAGTVSVGGVSGPAGTAWSWTAGTVRIGGIQGGSGSELDGRLGRLEEG